MSSSGRYLLFLDILGFSEMVSSRGVEEIYSIINGSLKNFERWERLNSDFQTIYFSDTFLFYQVPKGYGDWAFLDIYAISAFLLSALLAKGIPARGTISFGEFEVRDNESGRSQLFYGKALVEAYKAERQENWIGITILKSAWAPYEQKNPGVVSVFEREGVWKKRADEVLLLNPFIKLRGWYDHDRIGEITKPYTEWDAPEFPNDIFAFKFIRDTSREFKKRGDFSSKIATKYHNTDSFLKEVLGQDIYDWGIRISENDETKR